MGEEKGAERGGVECGPEESRCSNWWRWTMTKKEDPSLAHRRKQW